MIWNELYPKDRQSLMNDIAEYSGSFEPVWNGLLHYFETAYK